MVTFDDVYVILASKLCITSLIDPECSTSDQAGLNYWRTVIYSQLIKSDSDDLYSPKDRYHKWNLKCEHFFLNKYQFQEISDNEAIWVNNVSKLDNLCQFGVLSNYSTIANL